MCVKNDSKNIIRGVVKSIFSSDFKNEKWQFQYGDQNTWKLMSFCKIVYSWIFEYAESEFDVGFKKSEMAIHYGVRIFEKLIEVVWNFVKKFKIADTICRTKILKSVHIIVWNSWEFLRLLNPNLQWLKNFKMVDPIWRQKF